MKNKLITCLSLGLLTCISFTSCNKGIIKLNPITEESAINLANEIVKRENASDFKQPSWFTYKRNYHCEYNAKLYETGIYKANTTINEEYLFNLDDLIIKETIKTYEIDSSSIEEIYIYFDESKTQLVTLTNSNGIKKKTTEDIMNKDYAVIRFKNIRNTKHKLINDEDLVKYKDNLDKLKQEQERVKGKSDQYVNIYHGSNDGKSLQLLVDQKLEKSEELPLFTSTYTLKGYEIMNTNTVFSNDLTDLKSYTYSKELKCDEYGFYINDHVTNEEDFIYGKVKINLPNVDEYKED